MSKAKTFQDILDAKKRGEPIGEEKAEQALTAMIEVIGFDRLMTLSNALNEKLMSVEHELDNGISPSDLTMQNLPDINAEEFSFICALLRVYLLKYAVMKNVSA